MNEGENTVFIMIFHYITYGFFSVAFTVYLHTYYEYFYWKYKHY